jgi:hypothetical protein
MSAIVARILQARADFLGSGMQCRFWETVVESEFPGFASAEYRWLEDTNIRETDFTLASEYLDAGLRLEPTPLPAWDD